MQTITPQLSSYIKFNDLLSALEEENLISYKEKQQLKVSLTLKDTALMNMIALHMECDAEEFRYGVLGYIQSLQDSPTRKHQRSARRSKSTISEITLQRIQSSQSQSNLDSLDKIDEVDVFRQLENLNKTLTKIVQQEQEGNIISIKLKESLNRLGKFTARFDAQPASFSEIETQEEESQQMLINLKMIYKKIKKNFSKYMHSHLLIMDELISYEQLFKLLRLLPILLVACDSFSYVVLRQDGVDVFKSETDTFFKIDSDLSKDFNTMRNDKLKLLGSEQHKLYNILGCEKYKRSYIHRLNQQVGKEKIFFVYHQGSNMEKNINYNFLKLTNDYEFFVDLNELSLFLYDTIKHAKVQYFTPLQIAQTIQDIGLAFVRCSKYLLIEQMLEELHDQNYIVNKITNDGSVLKSPKKGNGNTIMLEFKDTIPIFVQFQNMNLSIKRDRSIFLEVQQSYDKYLRFIKQSYEKRAFYKYFLKSNDSLIFEFDKRGQLCFLSRTIPVSISEKYNITFNLTMVQNKNIRYNQIFEENPELTSAIENHLQKSNEQRVCNDYKSDSSYEIIIKTEERSFKGFVVIFQQRQEAWAQNQQKTLAPKNEKLDQEIIRRIRKSFIQHETQSYVSMLSQNLEMSNSVALLYIPQVKKPMPSRMLSSANQIQIPSPRISKQNTKSFNDIEQIYQPEKQEMKSRFFPKTFQFQIGQFEHLEMDQILDTPDFNILEIESVVEKHRIVWAILKRNNFIEEFDIPNEQLGEFLNQIEVKYNATNNPFHNYDHGVSVMQFTHYITQISTTTSYQIDLFTQFTLLISALCHDVAHTGRTNLYEINSLSTLAIRYHDKSVLEQHHAATTVQMLREEKSNILINLAEDQFKQFRKKLIQNIFHTDMSDHFRLIKDFECRISESDNTFGEQEQDERLLTGMIIHCADFNGGVRKFPISHKWSHLVNQEFISQYREEGELGYSQLAYMKDLHKIFVMAKSEMGFFKVIVRPLYVLLSNLFEGRLKICVSNIDETILEWDKIYNQELAKQLLEDQSISQNVIVQK